MRRTVLSRTPSSFSGFGKLHDPQVYLHIDPSVAPVAQPHRRIPFHLRKKVKEELNELEKLDIIERVEGPTPWAPPPIMAAPKPGNPHKIRLCVDMGEATATSRHSHH